MALESHDRTEKNKTRASVNKNAMCSNIEKEPTHPPVVSPSARSGAPSLPSYFMTHAGAPPQPHPNPRRAETATNLKLHEGGGIRCHFLSLFI